MNGLNGLNSHIVFQACQCRAMNFFFSILAIEPLTVNIVSDNARTHASLAPLKDSSILSKSSSHHSRWSEASERSESELPPYRLRSPAFGPSREGEGSSFSSAPVQPQRALSRLVGDFQLSRLDFTGSESDEDDDDSDDSQALLDQNDNDAGDTDSPCSVLFRPQNQTRWNEGAESQEGALCVPPQRSLPKLCRWDNDAQMGGPFRTTSRVSVALPKSPLRLPSLDGEKAFVL